MKSTRNMQEIQKATCSRCGTTFVAKRTTTTLCPSGSGINNITNIVVVVVDTKLSFYHFLFVEIS